MNQHQASVYAKLDALTTYEVRAMYYLVRAMDEADAYRSLRVLTAIEGLVGKLTNDEAFALPPALMQVIAEKDPDIVARQAIKEAYQFEQNTDGRV
ncbi:hypothetical protein DYU11_18295 [Fibrisoma montanum]|uniref:Uncharacterized protein n=1 Tax=Fibrisoma montanum TaxID=2305895 RepID=A0A418M606_9BACT|nr:hypothetical protein [Fibrisoma montanum]RIV21357.1 hypothetical protein DYU11_18295 [Fibrisoma montanum]